MTATSPLPLTPVSAASVPPGDTAWNNPHQAIDFDPQTPAAAPLHAGEISEGLEIKFAAVDPSDLPAAPENLRLCLTFTRAALVGECRDYFVGLAGGTDNHAKPDLWPDDYEQASYSIPVTLQQATDGLVLRLATESTTGDGLTAAGITDAGGVMPAALCWDEPEPVSPNTTITIQRDLDGGIVRDAHIAAHAPNTNFGGSLTLMVGYDNDEDELYRLLMDFDLAPVVSHLAGNPGEQVLDARLLLTVSTAARGNVWIDRMLRSDWLEGGVPIDGVTSATWIHYRTDVELFPPHIPLPWTEPGCDGLGTDYTDANRVITPMPSDAGGWEIGGLSQLVRDALDTAYQRLLLRVRAEVESGRAGHVVLASSSEATPNDLRPKLIVTIGRPGGNGGSAALAALGANVI